ncbi:MAG: undecaprenyl-diphosphatase UppP [Anaerolineaceae bacterium]|nr:undecaprenyl-diphosphatase UppP [Anaerolineaceae bacterium]
MTLIQAIILGIVQGLTEFLPISSSAHLVLVPDLLGWQIPEAQVFPFGVLVQMGTLIAVILYFWSDLWMIIKAFVQGLIDRKPFDDTNARRGWYLILATIPAGLAGMLLKDKVEAAFNDPNATAYFLFGTAALLVIAEAIGKRSRNLTSLTWFDALWMGLFQAISIFPGISRSGATIAGGMMRNMDRSSAARFSFLMSIPIMLGAGVVSMSDALQMADIKSFLPIILVGIVAALLVGYLSIHWLLGFLTKRSFYWFALYCFIIGSLVLIVGTVRGNAQAAIETPAAETAVVQSTLDPTSLTGTLDQNPLTVAYTASLEWLTPAMATCAQTIGSFSIITHNLPVEQLEVSADAIHLRWGAPDNLTSYAAILGTDRLALIVNPANPLTTLTTELTQKIAGAGFSNWGEIAATCPECFSSALDENLTAQAPALNFYPGQEEPQALFVKAVMSGQPVAGASGLLVPGGKQMLEIVASDPAAFGFVPSRFLSASLKEVSLSGVDPAMLQMPLLAISSAEPTGKTRDWLLCLQKVLNP